MRYRFGKIPFSFRLDEKIAVPLELALKRYLYGLRTDERSALHLIFASIVFGTIVLFYVLRPYELYIVGTV